MTRQAMPGSPWWSASIPAFEDGKDPRAAVLQWVAGNAAVSASGAVSTSTAGLLKFPT